MKLKVNYDLLYKITAAKTGFALDRTRKDVIMHTLFVESFVLPLHILAKSPLETMILSAIGALTTQVTIIGIGDLILKKLVKEASVFELLYLTRCLSQININTNYDLLLNSYKYETEYEFEFNKSNFPQLVQKKYIMVPAIEDGEEIEVSVLQEHIIGSKDYVLSKGKPSLQKSLKLVRNSI